MSGLIPVSGPICCMPSWQWQPMLVKLIRGLQCAGTGSLRVGAEFLAKHYPGPKTILTPTPTWANHDKLFPQGGLKIQKYRYYKADTRGLDYEVSPGRQAATLAAPAPGSVVLWQCVVHALAGM